MMIFISLVLPGLCCVCSQTVMHVLLFVLHVCMLKECDGAWVTAMLVLGIEVWVW